MNLASKLALGGAAAAGLAVGGMRLASVRRRKLYWKELRPDPGPKIFEPDMVADLPEPARRYFRHAIVPGTPLARSVTLKMGGTIRLQSDGDWLPMEAKQRLAPPVGFVWKAQIEQGLTRFKGADYLYGDRAGVDFWLWGVVPVARGTGPDTLRSSRGRMLAESLWLPSALLPAPHIHWEQTGDDSARVTMTIDAQEHSMQLHVGDQGNLESITMQRWGDFDHPGRFTPMQFGAEVDHEGTFGGYTIPTRLAAGWWYGTDDWSEGEFIRPVVEPIEFI